MSAASSIEALLALMARLRDPQRGCPWDREQTFVTIAPYTIEEAYEVADAIERGDPRQLRDELGDLLFQVVFHARMAQERGWFDFAAVADSIHEKLVRRHPHVFTASDSSDPATLSQAWEEHKALERAAASGRSGAGPAGTLDDVPLALPALLRAGKLGKRASRVGFDWNCAAQVREKVQEELEEVDAAIAAAPAGNAPEVVEEMGDLLFALANWSRHLKFNPEEALRAANAKFERRFRAMEALAGARALDLQRLTPQEWEDLWLEAKRAETRPGAGRQSESGS